MQTEGGGGGASHIEATVPCGKQKLNDCQRCV